MTTVNIETQEIVTKIWDYFEDNHLTNGKPRPNVVLNDFVPDENYIQYELQYRTLEEIEEMCETSYRHEGCIGIHISHQGVGHIILEEFTHYIRSEPDNPQRSADFSVEFIQFVASQINEDVFDYDTSRPKEFKRGYQTDLFVRWWDQINLSCK